MSNDSVEITHRLVSSCEECFSQASPDCLSDVRARPLLAGVRFEELKVAHEDAGDGHELMKKASHLLTVAMIKTTEVDSSPAGSTTLGAPSRDSFFDENSTVPPSSRLEKFKKKRRLNKLKSKRSSSSEQSREDRVEQARDGRAEVAKSFDIADELKM